MSLRMPAEQAVNQRGRVPFESLLDAIEAGLVLFPNGPGGACERDCQADREQNEASDDGHVNVDHELL